MELLFKIVLISLFCNGMYLLFNWGNLLEPIRKWYIDICGGVQGNNSNINWTYNVDNQLVHAKKIFLYKPLFGCITCMASIWGSIAYWTITYIQKDINIHSLILYPIIIVCCSAMNFIINRLYE